MIKVTLGDLKQAEQGLKEILELPLPPKHSIHVARMVRKVGNELSVLEDRRVKLIKEMGESDDKGNFKVPEDKVPDFMAKMNEMLEVTVDLDIEPLSETTFGNAEVKAKNIVVLGPLFN